MNKAEQWKNRLGLDELPDAQLLELLENTPDEPAPAEGSYAEGFLEPFDLGNTVALLQAKLATHSLQEILIQARAEQGKSLAEVGQQMGVSKGRVGHIEAQENLEIGTLVNYADAIGYDVLVTLKPRRSDKKAFSTQLPRIAGKRD